MRNNQFNTNDIKRVCENKLDIEFRKGGKEQNGWFIYGGKKISRITVPKGRKNVPPKTYKSMATQLKISTKDFDSLLECPLTKKLYELKLSKDGHIQLPE